MTNQLRDILIHLLSDDPLPGIPDTGESPDPKERELISSFLEKKVILQQKTSRMDAIFAHSPQPIIILNPAAVITEVNQSFLHLSGLFSESCVGKPVKAVLPGFLLPADGYTSTSSESEIFSINFPSGKRVLEQYPIPVHDNAGILTEIILVFKDITIRVLAEERAEEIRQKLAHDYGERVKEQKLFYSVASLVQDDSKSLADTLRETTDLIPPGWQYPDITGARIQFQGNSYQTDNFIETPWIQKATFKAKSGNSGVIDVVYLTEKPSEHEGPFLLEERNLINSLAEMLKTYTSRIEGEQELARKMHDLGERVKEQTLFYKTASLIQDDSKSVDDTLCEITDLIPPGWQYPDITGARIRYLDKTFQTGNFKETPWIQKATFNTKNGNNGVIEVVYLIEKPSEHEGPFLLEERNLINSLAEMVKTYIIRIEGEQELAQKMHDLGERVKEQQLFYKTASLIQDDSISIDHTLHEITDLIPPGWQYPEITAARIRYQDKIFQTHNFKETPWIQKASFSTKSGKTGLIEVMYLTEKPSEYEGPFLLEERNLINSLAEMLKTYIVRIEGEQELSRKMHDLGERVKEQQLFYKTASLIQDDSLTISDVLQKVVTLIPPGWQYPEITGALILYDDITISTENYRLTSWLQTSSFVTRTGKTGRVEVVYLSEKPPEHEGPFLLEERNLINSLADMLKTYLDRKEGEQELERRMVEIEELEHLNNTIVQQIPMPVLLIDENQQILVTNDAYIRLTGYTRDELLRMTPRDITVLEYTGEGLKELLSTMKPTFGELTCKFPVGIRILEQYGIPIYSKSGSLENLLIVYNDITERKRQEEEVQKLLDDSRTMSETLSESAGDLKTGMARIAEGDLRYRAPVMEHDPLSQIKNDYNTALSAISLLIEELEGSISHLNGTSEKTLSQTDNIKQAIRNIADEVQNSTVGARDQMEETRRISADIRLLSDRISQIVEITTRLMELAAQTARQGAEAGQIGGVANEKMESVGKISADNMKQITGLNEQMAEIDKIVRLISDISSQTNLLALNAAIEAARAGEHGRGFAVVAQEVKNLAGQSKLATYQIEELIRSIQTKSADTVTSIEAAYTEIQEGIASVNKTIDALSSITSQVTEISDGISQVTRATMDEETLMQRVQEGIGIMNSETEKNLARMEEISHRMDESRHATDDIASSSLEIARLSGNLKKQADRFSL